MKAMILIALCGLPFNAFCQVTNWPVLTIGTQSFTNARLGKVTPSEALVYHEGGIEKVPMSKMPSATQRFYNYDPQKEKDFLANEALKQKQRAELAAKRRIAEQQIAIQRAEEAQLKSQPTNDVSVSWTQHYIYIEGFVTNNTDVTLGHVRVNFNLYDRQDIQVSSASASCSDLLPKSVWKFETTTGNQYLIAKFVDVDSWRKKSK